MIRKINFIYFTLFTIALLCAIYFPVINVGFYLDDFDSIVNNPVIQNPSLAALNQWYPMRQLGYFSIAVDYYLNGLNPAGYHINNVVYHFIVVISIYWLCHLLVGALKLDKYQYRWFPVIVAIIFAVLPLNSQAIVYVIQRLAILAALFYVLGIASYLKFRLIENNSKYIWLILSVLFFVSGMHVKQNVATFPIAILLIELIIFRTWFYRNFTKIALMLITAILAGHLLDYLLNTNFLMKIDSFSRETSDISRWEYLTHQFYAYWVYIGKFLIAYPLRLEYSQELLTWSDSKVWLGFLLTLLTLCLAYLMRFRAPLVTLCIALYFTLHLVESSIIPITDLIFEHRSYLPNVALCILIGYLIIVALKRRFKLTCIFVGILFVSWMTLLHHRLTLWTDPIEFYRWEMTYEGDSSRLYGALAAKFAEKNDRANAMKWFRIALKVGEDTGRLSASTVISYIDILNENGEEGWAKYYGVKALSAATRYQDQADILAIMAKLDVAQGQCREAMGMINRALKYHPGNLSANYLKSQCEAQLENNQER